MSADLDPAKPELLEFYASCRKWSHMAIIIWVIEKKVKLASTSLFLSYPQGHSHSFEWQARAGWVLLWDCGPQVSFTLQIKEFNWEMMLADSSLATGLAHWWVPMSKSSQLWSDDISLCGRCILLGACSDENHDDKRPLFSRWFSVFF